MRTRSINTLLHFAAAVEEELPGPPQGGSSHHGPVPCREPIRRTENPKPPPQWVRPPVRRQRE